MADVLDRSSPIPRVTWGVFLSVLAAFGAGTVFFYRMNDVAERQQKYIERRDEQHATHQEWSEREHAEKDEQIAKLREEHDRLCEAVALHIREAICH